MSSPTDAALLASLRHALREARSPWADAPMAALHAIRLFDESPSQ